MNSAYDWISSAGTLLLLGCSSSGGPPLASRGLPLGDRYAFITQNGYDIKLDVRDAFLTGCIIKGMRREFVFQLYGIPDRGSDIGDGWEYIDRKGNLITGVLFKGDKVDSVYGDPSGASPPDGPCRQRG